MSNQEDAVASAEAIQQWFMTTGGASLVLPDGWFGQPDDNIHELTFVELRPRWLVVELDGQILLCARNGAAAIDENNHLIIHGFDGLVVDFIEFGNNRIGHTKIYGEGEVRLVPI